ncbi:MAG: exodeoxyribonuclease V subunit gamma [gamma proteobacterium symbiont of Taylorina sp.]|nr:exodeoxyribonuclease V subunit gamma [gamma proteobacterium symbiont of Taylorina sp.]
MLIVYPSNKMEDLVQLLKAVQAYRGDSLNDVLLADTILLESKGMQHWLNLKLAEIQGVAMNYQFQMPGSFIWDLARTLLGSDQVPRQSAYRREVLVWRLDAMMCTREFIDNPLCAHACHYWAGDTEQPDLLKRFQLATQLADIFEQYLLFRPDWLSGWEQNKMIADDSSIDTGTEQWQAWLWRQLVLDEPSHPVILQKKTIKAIAEYSGSQLPKQIMIFAINTMAPQTLDFFNALSSRGQCNIHLFYLNPCVEFWGDVKSDKARARQMREQKIEQWLDMSPEFILDKSPAQISNSLLANLGQQGKEFFNLLQDVKGYEISAFDEEFYQEPLADEKPSDTNSTTVLSAVQRDILTLSEPEQSQTFNDQSIVISSSHSELREIQALHDYLLHQLNEHPDWKPQDVVVMCPAIEDYAPYIEAVFRRPWDEDETDDRPRLPCSIADRTLMNAEPLIAVFVELLQLPDSRFEISKILDYLRLPALQAKFGFENSELDTIEWWLQEASVHWGRDTAHKKQLVGLDDANAMFTWQWGLERLLSGFAQSDAQVISSERLLLPHVEGQDALLLGRLMQLLERLKYHAVELCRSRTAQEWQSYLTGLTENFFQVHQEEQAANELIRQVINELVENTAQAKYAKQIDYAVVRNYLQKHFSSPDSANHFLTGQVTFCSMMPMRSIPFKVIAILGLNDGHFPRQNTPMSFDLMAQGQRKPGDRSRRGDDRYLFLEALISARNNLYLSYQGRDIHKNSERQPSLIVKELMNYLTQNYHWKSAIEQPLHPFSKNCYMGKQAGFDPGWKRMIRPGVRRDNCIKLLPLELNEESVRLEHLVRFFDNPLKEFCHHRLNLKFENNELTIEDTEPFVTHALDEYQIRDEFCQAFLDRELNKEQDQESAENLLETIRISYKLGGQLPDSPLSLSSMEQWEDEALIISQAISGQGKITTEDIEVKVGDIQIQTELHWLSKGKQLLLWRPAKRNAKDDMRLWLNHLLATVYCGSAVTTQGLFFNKKTMKVESVSLLPVAEENEAVTLLEQLIQAWQTGLCQPSLIHARLGRALLEKNNHADCFEALKVDPKQNSSWNSTIKSGFNKTGLDMDDYFYWFYPDTPALTLEIHQALFNIYQPLYQQLQVMK